MTPRPSVNRKQRPLSAIFIGSLGSSSSSTPPDLPKLPEPPSPEESSPPSRTGLPSPPATNSTGSGSGSNGDDSINAGSLRSRKSQRTYSVSEMYNVARNRSQTSVNSASNAFFSDEDDDPHDHERDEDSTARLDSHRRRSATTASSEHTSALQRVKSLTERNRMILSKLTSMSRHSSPVPPKQGRTSSSPAHTPSPTPLSSRPTSSARLAPSTTRAETSSISRARHLTSRPPNSGSETERESTHVYPLSQAQSSSDSMSTPTSQHSEVILMERSTSRHRRGSVHNSPGAHQPSRAAGKASDRSPSPGPSKPRTPRKRASMSIASTRREQSDAEDEDRDDVMSAALAAVASSRRSRSPGGSVAPGSVSRRGTSRNTLPGEFREPPSQEFDSREMESAVPYTPRHGRNPSRHRRSPSPSPHPSSSQTNLPLTTANGHSPKRPGTAGRTSTIRELTRRHQTRWLSEDLSSSLHGDVEDKSSVANRSTTSLARTNVGGGRRQTPRGGSDGPLSPGRSLAGEGLRAAGIGVTRRRDPGPSDDPFGGAHAPLVYTSPVRRTRSTGAESVIQDGPEWDSPAQMMPNGRVADLPPGRVFDYRTPEPRRMGDRPPTSMGSNARASTSMASLIHDNHPLLSARATPAGHRPGTSASGAFRGDAAEHRRLMLDALNVFESQLSRLPPMGQTTTTTIPDVFQHTQQLVHGLDRLNSSIRNSASKSLEAQVEAEIADGDTVMAELAAVWAQVGSDHREALRASDEIVRTMTQFLLGVGKIIRDATSSSNAMQHSRSVSLDEDIPRRLIPDPSSAISDRKSSDGRHSRETRRSWDSREAAQVMSRVSSMDHGSNGSDSRPPSSFKPLSRPSTASTSSRVSPSEGAMEHTPATSRHLSSALSSVSSRRLYTPRERNTPNSTQASTMMSSLDSQETIQGYEPSPTPASRRGQPERTRALPPISIPPSLSTLPSESLLTNSSSTPALERNRRKVSTNSSITIRAEPSLPSVIKPPNTTTALTTTSVDVMGPASSITRSDSENSIHSNGVTFSKPSSVSSSTLNSLRRQDASNSRARSMADQLKEELRSPMSGSETERPRTFHFRGRTSLDGPRADSISKGSQASTLTGTRRERRRTITEIFAQGDQ